MRNCVFIQAALMLCCFLSINAHADCVITIEHPTTYADGTPLDRASILHYEACYMQSSEECATVQNITGDTVTLNDLYTHVKLKTVTLTGAKSVYSNTFSKPDAERIPSPVVLKCVIVNTGSE